MRQTLSPPEQNVVPSKGPLGWWYRLAAPPDPPANASAAARAVARRGQLASLLLLAIIGLGIVALPTGFATSSANPIILPALVAGIVGCLVGVFLNRQGMVMVVAILLVLLLNGGFLAIALGAPLDGPDVAIFDLFVFSELVAVSLMTPVSVFVVAVVNGVVITLALLFAPHTAALAHTLASPGSYDVFTRPIALQLVVAVVTYLFARGEERAIQRADRAEEIAALEARELERTRQIEQGVEQLLQTHVRVANGDYSVRATLGQNNVLWQVAVSLNNLLSRLQRSAQAEFELQRVNQEVARLVSAIRDMRAGRPPLWPAPSKTVLDPLIAELAPRAANGGQSPTQGAWRSNPSYPSATSGQIGAAQPWPNTSTTLGRHDLNVPSPYNPAFGAPMQPSEAPNPNPSGVPWWTQLPDEQDGRPDRR